MSKYTDKFKDPRWQKKRLEIMERDKFTCRMCKSKEKTLNVHHLHYESGKDPWGYRKDDLVTLCEDCHVKIIPVLQRSLSDMTRHAIELFEKNADWFISEISSNLSNSDNYSDEHREKIMRWVTLAHSSNALLACDFISKYGDERFGDK